MYFSQFYTRNYFTDTYWGNLGEEAELVLGAYNGLYSVLYGNIYNI